METLTPSSSEAARRSREWREKNPQRLEQDRAAARVAVNARRARLLAEGLCVLCGKVPPLPGIQHCEVCREKRRQIQARKKQSEPDYYARKTREHRARNQEKTRASARRSVRLSLYGEAGLDLAPRLAAQGGACAICGTTEPGKRGWCLDHDHRLPGKDPRAHRAVLCRCCNSAIGLLRDDPALMEKAAAYVLAHTARIDAAVQILDGVVRRS
jgi:hypothetical protein